ncbi:Dolichyl-phosphate beta-glucosyltransferase [Geodia barretti]|uniref:Dolichyl-phosphate beta-glucosyltransferase n=1 Tax=Geodia barretti TaxID=519541 RepID=A0AA35U2A1_GEOBA|nr:Dolichyl-phosphate beta-glucosyltransferase [Geodia barretti]
MSLIAVLEWAVSCAVGDTIWETTVRLSGLLGALFLLLLFLLFVFLSVTSAREPDLYRSSSEKNFKDPKTGESAPFPSVTDRPSLYLSLIVPAYKEQDRLPVMMDETMAYLEKRQYQDSGFTYEVIIVNDGSTDNTSDVALGYVTKYGADKVRLLEFTHNRGKGGAVRDGEVITAPPLHNDDIVPYDIMMTSHLNGHGVVFREGLMKNGKELTLMNIGGLLSGGKMGRNLLH